jgi:plastocyanin
VTFSGAFSSHPLAASTRGTTGSPITATSTGTTKAITFAAPGFFPYYCTIHGDNAGANMAGVIWVE